MNDTGLGQRRLEPLGSAADRGARAAGSSAGALGSGDGVLGADGGALGSRQGTLTSNEGTLASNEVAGRIVYAILAGRIALGSPITERWILEQYGVSRTTAREVLQRLVTERYLERRPYRSASVRTFDEKEMRDSLDARLLIECEAARSCDRASPESIRRLQHAITSYCAALDENDTVRATTAHRELHTAIVALTGNSALTRIENELMLDSSLFIDVINAKRADSEKMRMEHVRLVGALLAGETELAERLVRGHLSMVTLAAEELG
ncbi:GntR family transcriptional regulator [Leucobacter sp. CSA1]|uniref:GntR family transcriptional regulator n=1 Tax=Leucobacter chromiisoli TaxID=2796471 RepID=A0A934UU76_9MICO|nr:GntR family transcriptional regulator [Leucobacter chromiisoli]MBK0417903.1 GntR family transcriptional regulator [Leucobacter chromiisoli]